jgi:ATP-dependent DNA ligase
MSPWKFQQIEPQPARGTLIESMWDDPNWIAEEKYDGDRRIAQFCGKAVRFTGRRKSVDGSGFVEKTENVPHLSGTAKVGIEGNVLMRQLVPPAALDGTVLDGEMIAHIGSTNDPGWKNARELKGGLSKYVTSIMGSKPEEAVRKQIERGWLRYVVFDCLFYKGKDARGLPLIERMLLRQKAVQEWANPFVSDAETARAERQDLRKWMQGILARGGEGVILKNLDHRYGDKNGWVKVKAEWTADVVIMGFKDAKEMSKKKGDDVPSMTKYAKAGLIGAIVCGQRTHREGKDKNPNVAHMIEVAAVSGMDDQLRHSFTRWPKEYIGKVIEIAHNGREPTGRFRHPRFKRFRDDKQAKDCIYREGEI